MRELEKTVRKIIWNFLYEYFYEFEAIGEHSVTCQLGA